MPSPSQGIPSENLVRQRYLLFAAWGALLRPLERGPWAHQRALQRKAFLALQAARAEAAGRISAFWVRWQVQWPLQRCGLRA